MQKKKNEKCRGKKIAQIWGTVHTKFDYNIKYMQKDNETKLEGMVRAITIEGHGCHDEFSFKYTNCSF